jgi:hypothetical protein
MSKRNKDFILKNINFEKYFLKEIEVYLEDNKLRYSNFSEFIRSLIVDKLLEDKKLIIV